MQTANEIVEAIHNLPRGEREKDFRTLENEKREQDERLKQDLERYRKASQWIDEHRAEYLNQWVCLEGDKLIACGTDGREVYRQAKESGIKAPFVHYVEEEPEAFWGGWL